MSTMRSFILGLLFSLLFTNQAKSQVGGAFFAVHCDPKSAVFWSSLERIVDSANVYQVPLTIMLTPPWVESILSDPTKLELIATWQDRGHEFAYHHHGLNAKDSSSWDGYTNESDFAILAKGFNPRIHKKGDMSDYMAFMEPLKETVTLTTGAIATETEWPGGINYRTEGVDYTSTDAFSQISRYDHNGYRVAGLTYANVSTSTVAYVKAEFNSFTSDYCAGLVTHANDFSTNEDKRNATMEWFQFMADAPQKKTVREIMEEAARRKQPPFDLDFSVEVVTDTNLLSGRTIAMRLNSEKAEKVIIRIYDQSGNLLRDKHVAIEPGLSEVNISAETLKVGSYSIEVSMNGFKMTETMTIKKGTP